MRTVLFATTLCLFACGYHPKGAVDMSTGLQGIGVDEGSLKGSWGLMMELDFIVSAGLLGDQQGGFKSHLLAVRTWSTDHYDETLTRCARDGFETGGDTTTVLPDTFGKLRPIAARSTADHKAGSYASDDVVELWGVQNLADPATSALPDQHNFMTPPDSDHVLDEDQDGNPGVTEFARGTVDGKSYEVERSVFAFDGTIITPDRVQGLVHFRSNQSNRLVSTAQLLLGETTAKPDPGRVSWFDSVRLKDGATCDDLAAAVSAGTIASSKPF